jgi:EAL domain-containing protein (putative c-di-GMP-specific phosphodiesterase class I)
VSKLGVGLAVDDFGTGYSSLAYLERLPMHELKIDKSFIATLAARDSSTVIVRSIIGLGHNLGLTVVAEGVETPETWDLVAALGCDVVQGYIVSRPLPGAEVTHYLDTAGNTNELLLTDDG